MQSKLFARLLVASCAGLFCFTSKPQSARAETDTTTVNGRIVIPVDDDQAIFDGDDDGDVRTKGGIGLSLSNAPTGHLRDRLIRAVRQGELARVPGVGGHTSRDGEGRGNGNVQANDPALDHIVTFDPAVVRTRPFEFATESETSTARDGKHIVVGFNSSANSVVEFIPGIGLAFTQLFFSSFAVSHDGGRSFTSSFVPSASPDVPFTFGDPSLAVDRRGNIFYASLGLDAQGVHGTVNVNKSTNHGSTFATAVVAAVDDGSDKEWMAIGPDPSARNRDNIYVTWTSFAADGNSSSLWLARSIDGGATFSTRQLFAPVDDGINSAFLSFSNPVVDASNGRLFVPFLHISDVDADNVRVLVSDDGGVTFHFLTFNIPGAVDALAFPNVQPGRINDCTGGGFRNALVAGADQGGGRLGTSRFAHATRLITQPAAGAVKGNFVFAVNSSTSPIFGDPTAGSIIRVVFSTNGGASFAPAVTIAASTAADPQHVHPAVSLSGNGEDLAVSFYVQQSDERLRTDIARLRINGNRLRKDGVGPLSSVSFDLTPSNVLTSPTTTTNFDRTVVSCYDIGEYQSLARSGGGDGDGGGGDGVFAAWGDNRNSWTSPPDSPAAGTHSQPDVFTANTGGD
jgi:hypothetical protein